MYSSSSREKTLPVGLLGEFRMMALVRGVKARAQFLRVEAPVGRLQPDVTRGGAAQLGVGAVVLVERLEQHHFVARIEHGQQRGDHALGGAAADRDFAVGVEFHAIGPPVFGCDGIAKRLGAPGDGVLIDVGVDGFGRGALQNRGRGKIGEALRQIDGPVAYREARHLADDGFGESGYPLAAEPVAEEGCGS